MRRTRSLQSGVVAAIVAMLVLGRRGAAVAAALVAFVALSSFLVGCDLQPRTDDQPRTIVMDDFESGSITDWQAVGSGAGGWFLYTDGQEAPDPAQSDPNAPFDVPDPPQGKFAAVTDMNGPGTRILYRDLRLDGRFTIHLTVFYAGRAPFSSPRTLAHGAREANQQFRIDLVGRSAPIDSVERGDVLVNVFHTSPGDPARRQPKVVSVDLSPWAGQTVRLRLAATDNRGPLRVGVDNISFERIGTDADARVELLVTPRPFFSVDLVLRRMSEADAVAALSARAGELARADEFSGAVLVARHGKVLLENAWGRADRESGTSNTPGTRFRIGSMNKMFTAVATLQLVEARKLALDDPIGRHLPDYPNKDVASKVTVRHLLTHTGGTGDIFGPEFERNRLGLREHGDYVKLYGSRGLIDEPGARFEYSNYGFVLLGALIEAVSGGSYYDYVRDNVFRPAGMTSTDSLPESEDVPNRAVGYMRPYPGDDWVPNTDTLPWRGTAAGGGYSTVGDLLRFAQALSSGTLISKATLAEATRPHQQRYGYGFGVQGEGPLRSYGHGGGAPGINGELRVFPQLGYVVVSLSNLDPPAASELVDFFAHRMPIAGVEEGPRAQNRRRGYPTRTRRSMQSSDSGVTNAGVFGADPLMIGAVKGGGISPRATNARTAHSRSSWARTDLVPGRDSVKCRDFSPPRTSSWRRKVPLASTRARARPRCHVGGATDAAACRDVLADGAWSPGGSTPRVAHGNFED